MLILLPFFAITFAIIDYGLAIFVQSTLQHAVREGVRYAVTYQTISGMCQDASIKTVVKNHAMGFLTPDDKYSLIQVTYYTPDTFTVSPSNNPGNIVEVAVNGYPWGWIAPLWRSKTPLNITVRSSDRMEGLPGGTNPPCR
jgi:Flp pilus assembly protein TadG